MASAAPGKRYYLWAGPLAGAIISLGYVAYDRLVSGEVLPDNIAYWCGVAVGGAIAGYCIGYLAYRSTK